MAAAIRVSNLTKYFTYVDERPRSVKEAAFAWLRRSPPTGGRRTFCALRDISFEIGKGELVGIMGRNGAGKSTIMKLLCGIYKPSAGSVETCGRVAPLIELGAGFNPELSGYENILLNAAILGFSRKATLAALPQIVEFSELGDRIYMHAKHYSSGMLVRLGFSIATHLPSPILLFDEVFGVGDAGFQQKCFRRIEELKAEGRTMVLVTHSPNLVKEKCERCIVIDREQKVFDGDPVQGANLYEELVTLGPLYIPENIAALVETPVP